MTAPQPFPPGFAEKLRAKGVGEATIRLNSPSTGRISGREVAAVIVDEKPPKRIRSGLSETQSQQQLVKWWAMACIDFGLPDNALMAFPLQGARTKKNASRMKAEGMRRGTPDLLLTVPSSLGHALFIEMKSDKGKLTKEQKEMLAGLAHRGYATSVCYSTEAAQEAIIGFLKHRETAV